MDLETARNFLIALAIGALVGIEREKKKSSDGGQGFGGIRTYTLFALIGAASVYLSTTLALDWAFPVALGCVGAAMVASYLRDNRSAPGAQGLTSEMAAIAVCLLGAMSVAGAPALAVALGVFVSAVLAYGQPLHGLVARIGTDDLYAAIKLLIASFIVLPLLPDATVDPLEVINPYKLWLLVVLISALSLLGYVAVRWLGSAHGTALTGVAGGLVSSTATTLSFARASRASDAVGADALSAGILLAWLVMFARVMVVVAVVNRALLPVLAVPFASMALAVGGFAFYRYRIGLRARQAGHPHDRSDDAVAVSNPFSLLAAVRFGLLFAVVLVVVELAQRYAPDFGIYLVSALAGSVDVDAITLSVAGDARGGQALGRAAMALTIAALANTLVKCAMVAGLGQGPVRGHVAAATFAVVAAGAAASWFVVSRGS